MEDASNVPLEEKSRWSTALTFLQAEDDKEDNEEDSDHPQVISAHNYDSPYYCSLPAIETDIRNELNRSTPISANDQDSNENMIEVTNSTNRKSTSSLTLRDGLNIIDSYSDAYKPTTPDSPVNSSMDYHAISSDIPAVFHQGRGKRGGIRLGGGDLQDLSLLLANPSTARSPLNCHTDSSKRSSVSARSSLSNNSQRIHRISLASSGSYLKASTISIDDENEFSLGYEGAEQLSLHSPSRRWKNTSIFPHHLEESDTNRSFSSGDVKESSLLSVLLDDSMQYPVSSQYTVCNRQENNPLATPSSRICYDYLNTGVCKRQGMTDVCRFRHLPENHIDAAIDKMKSGKNSIRLIHKMSNEEYMIYDMPSCDPLYPGQVNPYATPMAPICKEFSLYNKCSMEKNGKLCPNRHLVKCHPESVACRYIYNQLTNEEINAWGLHSLDKDENNPFSNEHEKVCFDYTSSHYCKRNQEGKICRFKHVSE